MSRCPPALALVLFLAAAPPDLGAQCAMCRTALVSSEEGQEMSAKLNAGILLLLGAPVTVVAGIGLAMVRSRKRLARR